jgi:glycerate kinase
MEDSVQEEAGLQWAPGGQNQADGVEDEAAGTSAKKSRSADDEKQIQPTAEQMVKELQQAAQKHAALVETKTSTRALEIPGRGASGSTSSSVG